MKDSNRFEKLNHGSAPSCGSMRIQPELPNMTRRGHPLALAFPQSSLQNGVLPPYCWTGEPVWTRTCSSAHSDTMFTVMQNRNLRIQYRHKCICRCSPCPPKIYLQSCIWASRQQNIRHLIPKNSIVGLLKIRVIASIATLIHRAIETIPTVTIT